MSNDCLSKFAEEMKKYDMDKVYRGSAKGATAGLIAGQVVGGALGFAALPYLMRRHGGKRSLIREMLKYPSIAIPVTKNITMSAERPDWIKNPQRIKEYIRKNIGKARASLILGGIGTGSVVGSSIGTIAGAGYGAMKKEADDKNLDKKRSDTLAGKGALLGLAAGGTFGGINGARSIKKLIDSIPKDIQADYYDFMRSTGVSPMKMKMTNLKNPTYTLSMGNKFNNLGKSMRKARLLAGVVGALSSGGFGASIGSLIGGSLPSVKKTTNG